MSMTTVNLVAVSGGLSRPSATRLLLDHLVAEVERLLREQGRIVDSRVVEVGDHAADVTQKLLTGIDTPALHDAVTAVEETDLLIAASPVYRGSYTGLFKSFFDVVDQRALTGTPVLLAASGGSERHALVVDHELRPLFAFFQASTVPTAVYATASDCTADLLPDDELQDRIRRAAEQLVRAVPRRVETSTPVTV
jgi:FMN reductase